MVERLNSTSLVEESLAFFQRGLHLSPSLLEALKMPASIGYPAADGGAVEFYISCGGGSSLFSKRPSSVPSFRKNQKRRKRLRMKGHSMSLGIDVSHGDCLIAALTGRLVNAH